MDNKLASIAYLMLLFLPSHHAGGILPPAWSRGTETTSISEDAPVGTQIAVTTTAVNTPTAVSILPTSVGDDATTLFSVATDGTNVQLTTAGLLDRETTASFVLHLRASNDGGDTSTEANYGDLQLTVNVNDVNDNDPVFSTTFVCREMDAESPGSTSVETMVATDADSASNALGASPYSFAASQSQFDISASTGEVTVKAGQTLASGSYNLQIIATDDGSGTPRSGSGTLIVCAGSTCCSSCSDGCNGGVARHETAALTLFVFISTLKAIL